MAAALRCKRAEFPEVDRVAWFALETAESKIFVSQRPFLERLPTWPLGAGRQTDTAEAFGRPSR